MAVRVPVTINKNNCSFGYYLDWDEIVSSSIHVKEAVKILQANSFKYCVTAEPIMELGTLYELAWTRQKVYDVTPKQNKIDIGVIKKDILRGSRMGYEVSSIRSGHQSQTSKRPPKSVYQPSEQAL